MLGINETTGYKINNNEDVQSPTLSPLTSKGTLYWTSNDPVSESNT